MKVQIEGFPLVSFTGKIVFPDGGDLYVKFGTEGLQCEPFMVEVEGGEALTEEERTLAALEKWCGQVEDVIVARLGGLCDKARARVESKRGRGLGTRPVTKL
jgi:hypothetical protein